MTPFEIKKKESKTSKPALGNLWKIKHNFRNLRVQLYF